jgi:alpha-aminoadipic semialdehyde synthase
MPNDFFMPGKTYIFFSHVIKGQEYNMPMLKKMIEKKVNLIDYEKIADDEGRRLIFFGRFAGLAGMINSLWALGLRLQYFGYDTPFKNLKQTHKYSSLDEAKNDIREAGRWISENGLPEELLPFTIGFTGYGNVSNGAQEIADLLPGMYVSPEELIELEKRDNLPDNIIYKTVFKEEHIVAPNAGQPFELQDYYDHPEKYDSQFERYLPHLSVLMNCMYWDDRYPRIVTKDYLKKVFREGAPKLTVIGDVTCDPDGSIECTFKGTEIEDPIFVYNPYDDSFTMGHEGEGILDMAVDILPSELPLESSIAFSNALVRYLPAIASEDYSRPFEQISLPGPVKRAMILHHGKLTPDYQYLEEYLK